MADWLQQQWYKQRRLAPALWLLLPLHSVFVVLSGLRRCLYRWGWLAHVRLPVPVIVIGNLTVGGAGKTPLVCRLAQALQMRGRRPGIISRGYGGAAAHVQAVLADSCAAAVGDEPLLLARRTGVPVWVGRDRAAVGQALLAAHPEVDVLLADDGLQHYRLARSAEVAVFDGRAAGNGWRLPLGPLRESLRRLRTVSAVVCNGDVALEWPEGSAPRFAMQLVAGTFYSLSDPARLCEVASLGGRDLHAVAGIADPARFFRSLQALGLQFAAHPFSDHHAYTPADLDFGPDAVLLMTEKDAVKCANLSRGEAWVLPVEAQLPPALVELLLEKINGR